MCEVGLECNCRNHACHMCCTTSSAPTAMTAGTWTCAEILTYRHAPCFVISCIISTRLWPIHASGSMQTVALLYMPGSGLFLLVLCSRLMCNGSQPRLDGFVKSKCFQCISPPLHCQLHCTSDTAFISSIIFDACKQQSCVLHWHTQCLSRPLQPDQRLPQHVTCIVKVSEHLSACTANNYCRPRLSTC